MTSILHSLSARLLAGGLLAELPLLAPAAIYRVTTEADVYDGVCNAQCSLRDAVSAANRRNGADVILVPAGTYQLTRPLPVDGQGIPIDSQDEAVGDLEVSGPTYIRGAGAERTFIRGGMNDRLFEVLPGGALALENVTLERGQTAYNGGAVRNDGDLVLFEVMLRENAAIRPPRAEVPMPPEEAGRHGHGGAVANYGRALIHSARLRENRVRGTPYGALYEVPSRGAAVYNEGQLLVSDSLFYNNADQYSSDWGLVSGLAVYNRSTARIQRSSLGRHGSWEEFAILLFNDGGRLDISDTTISDYVLGAVFNNVDAVADLDRVTIADGYGVGLDNWGRMRVRNSIVAGNIDESGEDPFNCRNTGQFQQQGLLLNSGQGPFRACDADFYVPLEESLTTLMMPLDRSHPRRWFHPLPPGSPAIDAAVGPCTGKDQRGISRPRDGDGDGVAVCDLGAIER